MSETPQTLVQKWRADLPPNGHYGSATYYEARAQCANELEAALAALPVDLLLAVISEFLETQGKNMTKRSRADLEATRQHLEILKG